MLSSIVATTTTTANTVATALNGVDMSAILQEVVNLLPVVIPVLIGFMAVRKGISFLIGSLRRA